MLPSSWYKSKRGRSYFAVFQSNFQSSFWSWDIWKREKLTELKVEVVSCNLVSEPLSTCLKLEWESELTKSEGKEGGRCGIFSILVSQTLEHLLFFQTMLHLWWYFQVMKPAIFSSNFVKWSNLLRCDEHFFPSGWSTFLLANSSLSRKFQLCQLSTLLQS